MADSEHPKTKTYIRPFTVMIPVIVHAEAGVYKLQEEIPPRPHQMAITVYAMDAEGAVERLQDKLSTDFFGE